MRLWPLAAKISHLLRVCQTQIPHRDAALDQLVWLMLALFLVVWVRRYFNIDPDYCDVWMSFRLDVGGDGFVQTL